MSQHTANPPAVMVRYDRMADGALVAVHTHRGRSVAAIVHPHVETLREPYAQQVEHIDGDPRNNAIGNLRVVDGPLAPSADLKVPQRRWVLAGDLTDRAHRPKGQDPNVATACAEAAQALGVELGVDIAGWSVETLDEARRPEPPPAVAASTCTTCGHATTGCVEYLRRDQGLSQPATRRWVCGCGATGVHATADLAGLIP